MNPEILNSALAVGSFLLGLGTCICGMVAWIGQSSKKKYAAERDFAHLKTAYQQLAGNQAEILQEVQDTAEQLLKALEMQQILLQIVLTKLGNDESIGSLVTRLNQVKPDS